MADGGGGPPPHLDGTFLLQLLQRPPQPPQHPSSAPAPAPQLPHEAIALHRDPAVAAVGPSYAFPPHVFLHSQASATVPIPRGFSPGPWAPAPGFPFFPGELHPRGKRIDGSRARPSRLAPELCRDLQLPQQKDGILGSNARQIHPGYRNMGSWGSREERKEVSSTPGARKTLTGDSVGGIDVKPATRSAGNNSGEQKARALRPNGPLERPGTTVRGKQQGQMYIPKSGAEKVCVNEMCDVRGDVDRKLQNRTESYSQSFPPPSEVRVFQGGLLRADGSTAGSCSTLQNGICRDSSELGPRSKGDFLEVTQSEEKRDSTEEDVDDCEIFETDEAGNPGSKRVASVEEDALVKQLVDALVTSDGSCGENIIKQVKTSRSKDFRLDSHRGHYVSSMRVRSQRRLVRCRYDIDRFTPYFLSIYQSLIPAEEEKAKQKQLLLLLEKVVNKEWPEAQLHLYGSCANSFGVNKSDIDICLAINDVDLNKTEILLKLAEILQSDNLQNVQALTHARVPIVKMMDPVTGISCDICINNLLAVVNTKLLRDYAQIDDRLRQLAFIVKHWAKSRRVNETYHGTLSSYAYVLMCIHFLQQCKPAILPCLQQMKPTCLVTVDDTVCAYFDQVERLRNFGAHNKESLPHLLWAFFHYWAYSHDYANNVISIRTGGIISKRAKEWTRRIGNDRHLICIEDPFEVHHDLGRVVDKYSIKILREEFERAACIMQYDPNPSVALFEPYVRLDSPESRPQLDVDE